MAKNAIFALLAACSMYASNANAEECLEPVKETEVSASVGYSMSSGAYGNADGVQVRLGGDTSLYTFGDAELILDSGFVTDYYGYDANGVQKDSLTDISALLMYHGFANYGVGGGLNVFMYDASGAYDAGRPMELTDYAIGPVLAGTINDGIVQLHIDSSLGFGQFGSNSAGLDFLLKGRLRVGLGVSYSGFSAEAYSDAIYNYEPYGVDSFELRAGARLGYRFVDFMGANAFYEHAAYFGENENESADSFGAGLSLFF